MSINVQITKLENGEVKVSETTVAQDGGKNVKEYIANRRALLSSLNNDSQILENQIKSAIEKHNQINDLIDKVNALGSDPVTTNFSLKKA